MAMSSRYSEQVKQGVESLINCLICTDRFEDPKVLPCQHTFCLPCLEHFYKSYNESRIISVSNFPCPQCRKSVYMPQSGLAALPTDFKVGQIKDVFDKINIAGSSELWCDVCRYEDKNIEVGSFCAQCSKYLCTDCTGQHSNNSLFRNHTTVSVTSAHTEELLCRMHKEVIKYYCQDCKLALCTVCALSKHSKHETIDLATAMDRNRTKIAQKVETLKANLVLYENKAEKMAALGRGRQRQVERLKEGLKKHARAAIARLREEEARLVREIDTAARRREAEIDKEVCKINDTARELKIVCDKTDAFLSAGPKLELINKFDSLNNNLDVFVHAPESKLDNHFYEEYILMANSKQSLGTLKTQINDRLGATTEGSPCAKKKVEAGGNIKGKLRKFEKLANGNGASTTLPPPPSQPEDPDTSDSPDTSYDCIVHSESVNDIKQADTETSTGAQNVTSSEMGGPIMTSSPMSSLNTSLSNPNMACSTATEGEELVSDASQSARSMNGEGGARPKEPTPPPRDTIRHSSPRQPPSNNNSSNTTTTRGADSNPPMIKPKDKLRLHWKTVDNAQSRGIAFLEDGTSVATEYRESSDKVQMFDPAGNLIHCVACSAQNILRPWGCAVNHQAGQIVITDHGDRAVKVLDCKDLALKQTWRSLFDKPSGVAVMRNGDYVITDTEKPASMVSLHTPAGIRKREFANKGNGLEQLMNPHYVTADHSDRIIISDSAQNCVKIYEPRGNLLLQFKAAHDPPLQPAGVCVDVHNNIIVADQANNTISLFSSDGLFIKNLVEINETPWGIAVHDNGSMAVTSDSSLHMIYVPHVRTL